MDKFMYIVEFWSPYYEYGDDAGCGVINVIAKDDEEVMSLLAAEFGAWFWPEGLTMECISNSDKFRLSESLDSRIVNSFTT